MDIANCPRCGKLFTRMSNPICEACEKEEEKIFQDVKKYIEDHPNSHLEEVATETGVSVKKLLKYLREGRLEVSQGIGTALQCDNCGKPIPRGRYCDTCVIQINQEVADAFAAKKPSAVMHTRIDKHGNKR